MTNAPDRDPAAVTLSLRPLAVSMGDPAGIGLDIVLKAWSERQVLGLPPFALFADPEALEARARRLGITVPIAVIEGAAEAGRHWSTRLPVVPMRLKAPVKPGHPNAANGPGIIAAIEAATAAVARGEASGLVTLPISKGVLAASGFAHPGHTEFLAELAARHWGGPAAQPVMLLVGAALRVVPLTVHVALADVPALVTRALIVSTARIVATALTFDFGIAHPRLAVAGLNPHAGEGGMLGSQERETIGPAIAALQAEGLAITGPYSADTMFHAGARERYDAALCMYHDQALIPLKTLAFDTGVNVTLGLALIRTSPDHGTAFDIAGTGKASPMSFIEALRLAAAMATRRAPPGPAQPGPAPP